MNTNVAEVLVEEERTPLPCGLVNSDVDPTFVEWYLHSAGQSWVPPEYHLWCALSAIAACVADRVWFEKFKGERLTANLYVMLIGPSGVGKNQAIRRAQKLVERIPSLDRVGLYRGKMSAQGILSYLGNKKQKKNYIWLVTPELAMQVGSGPQAQDFVTHMTELYDSDTTLQDFTRTSGHFAIERPCVNWLPGTTLDWMIRALGKADVLGGFFARIFAIPGERISEAQRRALPRPIRPDDWQSVDEWLVAYLDALAWTDGQMTMDEDATALHAWWIATREEPTDEMFWHFYSHGDNLLHKLAMCLALADAYSLVIRYEHVWNAIALYDWVYARLGTVLEFAHRTPEVEKLELLADYLRRRKGAWCEHVPVLRYLSNRGITRDVMESMLRTLVERKDAQIGRAASGRAYRWIGGFDE